MKKLLFILACLSMAGCAAITRKIEDKVVKDYYPGIEKKVVENVEKIIKSEVEKGNIKAEEVDRAREIIYCILIRVRDDLRGQIFNTVEKSEVE